MSEIFYDLFLRKISLTRVGMAGKGRRWRARNRRGTTCGCRSVPVGSDGEIVRLKKWMKLRGFRGCHLEPAIFKETGRGLRATQNFQEGATLISVPKSLLVTTTTVFNSTLGPIIKRYKPMLTPAETISVFLIWEKLKGPSSSWYPYIALLPKSYTNAAYWTEDEIYLLPEDMQEKVTSQITKVRLVLSNLQLFCVSVKDQFPSLQGAVTWESVRWAWSTINTRSVYMKHEANPHLSQQEDDHYALAPYLDLLNHSDVAEISASFNHCSGCYEIKTLRACPRFSQVFINYGPHDNQKLLTEYGFIVPNNQHSALTLYLDDLQKLATRFQVACMKDRFSIILDNDFHRSLSFSQEGASWAVFIVLRILCLTPDELKGWKTVLSGQPLCDPAEIKVKQMLQHLLTAECDKLPNIKKEGQISNERISMANDLCEEQKQIIRFNQSLLLD